MVTMILEIRLWPVFGVGVGELWEEQRNNEGNGTSAGFNRFYFAALTPMSYLMHRIQTTYIYSICFVTSPRDVTQDHH